MSKRAQPDSQACSQCILAFVERSDISTAQQVHIVEAQVTSERAAPKAVNVNALWRVFLIYRELFIQETHIPVLFLFFFDTANADSAVTQHTCPGPDPKLQQYADIVSTLG